MTSNALRALAEHDDRRHRLSVEDYHRIGEAGILAPDARVELIDGEIIDMAAIGTRHARCVNYLNMIFVVGAHRQAIVTVQNPVRIGDFTEVQPDLAVVRQRADFYGSRHPRPEDTLLLIEVADTTVRFDATVKLPIYARAGIPELWIVDIPASALRVFRDPRAEGYAEARELRSGTVWPRLLPDIAVDVAALLGD